MLKSAKIRAIAGRSRLGLALVVGAVLVPLVVLAVAAQAEILPTATSTSAVDSAARIMTHTNADVEGVTTPFSIPCAGCHVPHKAGSMKLLQADGAATICATCHDLSTIHSDPVTQQSVSAASVPGDCLSCHPHSSGFMPVSGAVSLTLSAQAVGYDDLDADGNLSPGDRVHYRIDYGNRGPEEVTGVLLRDEVDTAHIASVTAITGGGVFDGTAIQWDIGALTAGASGSVTYDALLQDALSFGDGGTASATIVSPTIESLDTTGSLTTTTTATTENPAAATAAAEDPATTSATSGDSTTTLVTDDPATTSESNGDVTTTTTIASMSAADSTDVVNTVYLTGDDREPVSRSVVVSVVVGGSGSTTSTVSPRKWGTTTTTSAKVVARPNDVVNTVAMKWDDREPVFASVVVSVVVAGPPSTDPPAPSTSEGSVTLSDSSVHANDEEADGHGARDEERDRSPRHVEYHRFEDEHDGAGDTTLVKRALGYDDVDADGDVSPGDRVHYRIDYKNLEEEDFTAVGLLDDLDGAHVASVEAITGGGVFDETTFEIQWDIGTLPAGGSGSVTYTVVLADASAFDGGATSSARTASPTEGREGTEGPTTSTTTTTEDPATKPNDPSTTESPTTINPSTAPGPESTGVPVGAALAVLPLAGVAARRFFPRRKARRPGPEPPERHQ